MNWLQFFLWISGVYAVYYLVVLLSDIFRNKGPGEKQGWVNELTFAEIEAPVRVSSEPKNTNISTPDVPGDYPKGTSAIIGSGGVLIKELFSLARKESIVYTGQVSY